MNKKDEMFNVLGVILGIAKPESKEDLDGIELYQRKVLRRAIKIMRDLDT